MTAGRVAVIGGGLAGMAAALALAERGVGVDLFEARRSLGGRAASYRDGPSGEQIDYCQHASMGCCTNLADFCRRANIGQHFQRFSRLHFIGPAGEQCDIEGSRWLPPPLHLAQSLLGLRYLSLAERLRLAKAMWQLARTPSRDDAAGATMAEWLRAHGQSPRVIDQFWSVILTSALAESLERISVPAARQVMVSGFMASRDGYQVLVPSLPLGELFGTLVRDRLTELGVEFHTNAPLRLVQGDARQVAGIELGDGSLLTYENVVLAVTWRHVADLLPSAMRDVLSIEAVAELPSSPITGIHLWFDRRIMTLPHAVLVGRFSQWVFPAERSAPHAAAGAQSWYYQVVVSASRMIVGADRQPIIDEVCRELGEVFSAARDAQLLDWQIVTDKHSVFSPLPGTESLRPPQRTTIGGLVLAGDWTATGWPATMESAVRSGYLAAEVVLTARGISDQVVVPELPRAWFARWLVGGDS